MALFSKFSSDWILHADFSMSPSSELTPCLGVTYHPNNVPCLLLWFECEMLPGDSCVWISVPWLALLFFQGCRSFGRWGGVPAVHSALCLPSSMADLSWTVASVVSYQVFGHGDKQANKHTCFLIGKQTRKGGSWLLLWGVGLTKGDISQPCKEMSKSARSHKENRSHTERCSSHGGHWLQPNPLFIFVASLQNTELTHAQILTK